MNAQEMIKAQTPGAVIGMRVLVGAVTPGRIDKVCESTEPGRWLVFVVEDRPAPGAWRGHWQYAADCDLTPERVRKTATPKKGGEP